MAVLPQDVVRTPLVTDPIPYINRTPAPDPYSLLTYGPAPTAGGWKTGPYELPDWMKPRDNKTETDAGLSDINPDPGVVDVPPDQYPHTSLLPRRRSAERPMYFQPTNANPFTGAQGGASGEGDSVQLPARGRNTGLLPFETDTVTGWVPPAFPNDDFSKDAFNERLEDLGIKKEDEAWTQMQDTWKRASDGGWVKDLFANISDYVVKPIVQNTAGGLAGGALYGATGNPYVAQGGAVLTAEGAGKLYDMGHDYVFEPQPVHNPINSPDPAEVPPVQKLPQDTYDNPQNLYNPTQLPDDMSGETVNGPVEYEEPAKQQVYPLMDLDGNQVGWTTDPPKDYQLISTPGDTDGWTVVDNSDYGSRYDFTQHLDPETAFFLEQLMRSQEDWDLANAGATATSGTSTPFTGSMAFKNWVNPIPAKEDPIP